MPTCLTRSTVDGTNSALIAYDADAGRFNALGGSTGNAAFCVSFGTFATAGETGTPFDVVEDCAALTLVQAEDVVSEIIAVLERTTLARNCLDASTDVGFSCTTTVQSITARLLDNSEHNIKASVHTKVAIADDGSKDLVCYDADSYTITAISDQTRKHSINTKS